MHSGLRVSRALLAVVMIGAMTLGCSSTSTTTTPAPPAPGTVTLDLSGVTGASGLVMLALVGHNLPTQPMAATCSVVDGDPFSFSSEYFPITGDEPCALGSVPVEFAPGSYEVIVAVLEGGSTSPEQCSQTGVTVNGDVTVEVTALGPPGDCDF